MARIHGRHGRLYLAPTDSGEAVPVSGTTSWTINAETDFVDATAQGDRSKQSLAGLPGSDFSFDGLYDDSAHTGNVFTAAFEGTSRKAYFYPDARSSSKYFFGKVFVSGNVTSGVSDATKISGKGAFETDMIPVGIA